MTPHFRFEALFPPPYGWPHSSVAEISVFVFFLTCTFIQKQQLEPSKHLVQNQIQSDFFRFFSGGPGWTTFDCSHFSHLQLDARFCLPIAQLLAVSQT